MKILQLYYKLPFPMNDGGAYAIYHSSLAMLSQNVDLKVLAMDLQKSRDKDVQIPRDFMEKTRFEAVPVDNRITLAGAFMNLFGTTSYLAERFNSQAYRNRLVQILRQEAFDVIQLEHLYLGVYLETIRELSNAKVILRTQNVENELWYAYLSHLKNPFKKLYLALAAKRLERFEKKVLVEVEGVMALTETDMASFRSYNRHLKITAVPVGLDLNKFPELSTDRTKSSLPLLYHLGSMDWKPNVLGMSWFVKEVWPLLTKKFPGITLVIAGKNMPVEFFRKAGNGLVVQGKVEDSLHFQQDKSILVVPVLAGSGVRIKILEAMALGKIVISTRVGAQGIACEDGKHILRANDPSEFVMQVERCLSSPDLCEQISRNARALIREKYELSKIGEDMMRFYGEW